MQQKAELYIKRELYTTNGIEIFIVRSNRVLDQRSTHFENQHLINNNRVCHAREQTKAHK